MKNYEYLLKYRKDLDLSYANMDKLPFYPNENVNVTPADIAIDGFTFMEAVVEFEKIYKETAFTKILDRDEGLVSLFKYVINVYLDENNYEDKHILNMAFYDWVLYSLEEIQEAINNKDYVQCELCYSIVPMENTGVLNGGFYAGKILCEKCLKK